MDTDTIVAAARTRCVCLPAEDLAWIDVTGADRARFLHALLSNVVAGVPAGSGNQSVLLTDKGRMVAPVEVLVDADVIRLGVPGAVADAVLEALDGYVIADDVELAKGELRSVPVVGPAAPALVAGLLGAEAPEGDHAHLEGSIAGRSVVAARLGRHGLPDVTLLCAPGDTAAVVAAITGAGADEAGADAAEILRIEAGRPAWGHELGPETLPMEAGLDPILHPTKGCYVGQETVVRVRTQGHVNWRIEGLLLDGAAPPAPGAEVRDAEGRAVGRVTSAVRSPTLGTTIALARLRREVCEPGTRLEVEGAGAEVAEPPFVP